MPRPTVSTVFNAVDHMTSPVKRMQQGIRRFAAVAGAALVTGGIARGIQSIVTEASKIEDAVAAFTPLMGGAEKANALVDALNQTAATTPFMFENISDTAKQLLPVMNQDIERTIDTFRMLGDTAGGNAQKLESITRGFTKAMLKGKVDLESLNMISEAGVPIFAELAKELGVSTEEMFKMVSAGAVTTDQLTATFQTMTRQGGLFFNGMEIASQTLTGKISTLKDNLNLTKAAIGQALLPTIKPLVDKAIEMSGAVREWVIANQDMIKQKVERTLKAIFTIAKVLWKLWDSGVIPAILAGVAAFKLINGAMAAYKTIATVVKAVQLALNAAMLANPIGLIIAAIAAFIALAVIAVKHFDEWGAALLFIMGPFGKFIELMVMLLRNWDSVKASFSEGGFLEGIKTIGAVIFQAILLPIRQIVALIEKITGGRLGGRLGSKLDDIMGGTQDFIDRDNSALVGRNDGLIESRSISQTEWNGRLDITGAPAGSTMRSTGRAPVIRMDYGYGGGL